MRGAATGPLQLGESTSEKGKSNPSWPSFVNEHTQGARWELQSLFKILRRPYNGSWRYKSEDPVRSFSQINGNANSPSTVESCVSKVPIPVSDE
jgi:hypothetical protein